LREKGIKISKSEKCVKKPLKNQGAGFDFYQLWDDSVIILIMASK